MLRLGSGRRGGDGGLYTEGPHYKVLNNGSLVLRNTGRPLTRQDLGNLRGAEAGRLSAARRHHLPHRLPGGRRQRRRPDRRNRPERLPHGARGVRVRRRGAPERRRVGGRRLRLVAVRPRARPRRQPRHTGGDATRPGPPTRRPARRAALTAPGASAGQSGGCPTRLYAAGPVTGCRCRAGSSWSSEPGSGERLTRIFDWPWGRCSQSSMKRACRPCLRARDSRVSVR